MYMTPMRLWSTLVIHSRHRYGPHPLAVIRIERASSTSYDRAACAHDDGLVERNSGPTESAEHVRAPLWATRGSPDCPCATVSNGSSARVP